MTFPQIGPGGMFGGLLLANLILPHHRIGKYFLYPLSFLAVWFHEMGHVVAAYVSGGWVKKVKLNANLGGLAQVVRPDTAFAALINPILGLYGPVVGGAAFIYLGTFPRQAKIILVVTAVVLAVTALIWIRNLFGFALSLLLGFGLFRIAMGESPKLQFWAVQALGIRLSVESISDFSYLYTRRTSGGDFSDTELLSRHLCMPHWVWGTLIALSTVGILGAALYFSWGPILLPQHIAPR